MADISSGNDEPNLTVIVDANYLWAKQKKMFFYKLTVCVKED